MARIVKEHYERRTEILDTAQALFYTQGYDRTSIQNIIDAVGIARGTFYHYFDAKLDLLDELIALLMHDIVESLEPMIADPQLDALQKLNRFFSESQAIKLENKQVILTSLQVVYKDENAILREKLKAESIRVATPILACIIQQGVAEGSFKCDAPDDLAEILVIISQRLSEIIVKLVIENELDNELMDVVLHRTAVYERAIERLLGAPDGSVQIISADQVENWFRVFA